MTMAVSEKSLEKSLTEEIAKWKEQREQARVIYENAIANMWKNTKVS